jgi:glycosyltransferase involved in cell wall biosynthesis
MINSNQLNSPPIIESIKSSERPLISVMIPTYNCAKYLIKTLESVLSQDLGEKYMEIEVVDDCSTLDDPELIVKQYGKGRVSFYKKEINQGATENFNTCIKRSRGSLIHILHGDDYILPSFYESVVTEFENDINLGICITRSLIVDENDELIDISPRVVFHNDNSFLFYTNPIRTPSVVVRRSIYEKFGGFIPALIHTSDWEMWIRVIFNSKGTFINKPLVGYRYFPSNDTGRLASTGGNLLDYLRMGSILQEKFKAFDFKRFHKNVVRMAINQAKMFKDLGNEVSYKMNLQLYKQLRKELSIFEYVKELFKNYLF